MHAVECGVSIFSVASFVIFLRKVDVRFGWISAVTLLAVDTVAECVEVI